MAVVLEYAARPTDPHRPLLSPLAMQILLTYAHVNLCWQVSQTMLADACSHMEPNFVAWTPLAWLPGCLATLWVGKAAGAAVMFLVSIFAGRMMCGFLTRYRNGLQGRAYGFWHDWRTWIVAVLWLMWIPVPALYAFVYQFGAWATHTL
jgi:hypothetical protein